MFDTFTIRGKAFRVANQAEINALQNQDGAPHVMFACTNCGLTHWTSKNIALGNHGGYTGTRNIFFAGDSGECDCHVTFLRCIVPDLPVAGTPAST